MNSRKVEPEGGLCVTCKNRLAAFRQKVTGSEA